MKRYEQGYDKINGFHGTAGRQNVSYFSLMKYLRFMLLTRSVLKVQQIKKREITVHRNNGARGRPRFTGFGEFK